MKKGLIFLAILLPSLGVLYFGMTRDPRLLPSTLVGRPAPDFQLTSLDGKTTRLRDLKGRPVIVNFWATWCNTCLAEHQLMRQSVERYASSGVLFYSVLYSDTPANAKNFVSRYGDAAPILLDPDLHTSIDYGVSGVPETFFVDHEGMVRYKQAGMMTPRLLAEQIALLTEGGTQP